MNELKGIKELQEKVNDLNRQLRAVTGEFLNQNVPISIEDMVGVMAPLAEIEGRITKAVGELEKIKERQKKVEL